MVDGTSYLATFMRQHQGLENNDKPRGENLLDGAAPFYEVYRTQDHRFVAVGAQEPKFYKELLQGMGLDMEKMPPQWDRTHWPRTKELIAKKFLQKTWDEWRAIFDGTDACVSPVLDFDETEEPSKPLVELSASPSLDVSKQERSPELKKGEGAEDVLQEWIPKLKGTVEMDPSSKLLTIQHAAKL